MKQEIYQRQVIKTTIKKPTAATNLKANETTSSTVLSCQLMKLLLVTIL
jgi:hypothetical protein